jgi:hypothetical protein
MNIRKIQLGLLFTVLFTASRLAHAQNEVCRVTTFVRDFDSKEQVTGSTFVVGEFRLRPEEESLTRFFHHQESGADISVGVERVKSESKGMPGKIRLAMSFDGKPDDVFDLIDNAEAESIYDKSWRLLAVSDNLRVGNRIYRFTFGCERKPERHNR